MFEKHVFIRFVILSLFFVSCFEEDEQVSPYPRDVVTIYDNIEYHQSYFDLESEEVVSSHASDLWQLGFECGAEGWHILVNSGAHWFVFNSGQTDINAEFSYPDDALWGYDNQSAYPDSTAIGNWVSFEGEMKQYTNHVYLLGRYSSGVYSGRVKIRFLMVDSAQYRFLYKPEEGIADTMTILKSDSANFVYFSFREDKQIALEPDRLDYDLVFGPYYKLATQFGITMPYLVRGVFLNTWNTEALLDSVNDYDAIDYGMIGTYELSSQRDVIGYQWKDVNVNTSTGYATYSVKAYYTYIVKTSQDHYYKLRFLSFSLEGNTGYPRFEYRELKPVL
ncbi:MAG: HmuY family protein [Bacteroidales bacterium]|jgi:hypothetical protein